MVGRGVAESLTSMGISRPTSAATISTSAPAVVPKVHLRFLAPVVCGLYDLNKRRGFEDGATHSRSSEFPPWYVAFLFLSILNFNFPPHKYN
jgi:hypothetical protein